MAATVPQTVTEPSEQKPDPEARMTFTAHLGELRIRLIRSLIAVAIGICVAYAFSSFLIDSLARPLQPLQKEGVPNVEGAKTVDYGGATWITLTPFEPFMVTLKISAYGGFLLALPYILYEFCGFVFPGLKPGEKRAFKILLTGCTGLAVTGVAVAYWLIFPLLLPSISRWAPQFVKVEFRLNDTLTLIMWVLGGFALAFQYPMVVLVLVYLGLVTPKDLRAYRKVEIVLVFVFAAIITPPDAISMVLMAVPMLVLYEIAILLSVFLVRYKKKLAVSSDT